MASLAKTYSREKLAGQVYTPRFIVQKILDDVGYNTPAAVSRPLLDPACGDGRFLVEAARRVIQYARPEDVKRNLEQLHGWDIDPEAVESCIRNLDALALPLGLVVDWQVEVQNPILQYTPHPDLFQEKNAPQQFDFIVGNPPYIRIQHLDERQRRHVQANFKFCQNGSTDIFIAFFELAAALLAPTGLCGFISPNTYFYTETARPLRQFFAAERGLRRIVNYADVQVFENATTYAAITIFGRHPQREFVFEKALSLHKLAARTMDFDRLKQPIWQLSLNEIPQARGKKLGEIAKIHVGITTLCDAAYMLPVAKEDGDFVWAQSKFRGLVQLEKAVTRPLVKASTLKDAAEPVREVVLFPYQKQLQGRHQIIPENELSERFPMAYAYLQSVRAELEKRDNGKSNPVAWYAFGRSQGLDTSFGKKILFSPMNIRPRFIYHANEEATFYSGYCIKYPGDPDFLLEQLNSERMRQFIEVSSRDFRGGWKAYNKKTLEHFIIEQP